MKLILYTKQHRFPIPLPDCLLLNTFTQRLIHYIPGIDTFGLSFSKEQLKHLRQTLRRMRRLHGSLCLFDLDDGVGQELGEKFQLYL